MTQELSALSFLIEISLWIAALCTLAFPILYLFSPWFGSKVGRVTMFQAVSLALAMNLTLLFQYWVPKSSLVLIWIDAVALLFIAIASAAQALALWRVNYKHRQRKKELNLK